MGTWSLVVCNIRVILEKQNQVSDMAGGDPLLQNFILTRIQLNGRYADDLKY